MAEVASWALVGPGSIGNETMRQLGQQHVAERLGLSPVPEFIVRSSGIFQPDGQTPTDFQRLEEADTLPDVTFIAMPSTDDGETALGYALPILERGKTVVTCEKGSMANHFEVLREASDDFARLGVNATVGGGTRMIGVAEEYTKDVGNITQMHFALNGTLSAIMGLIAPREGTGMSLGQAVDQAVKLGYAEPGAESTYDVIRGEAEGDIPKKTAILFNKLGLGRLLNWNDLRFGLEDEQISQVVEEAKVRRFIVSMYSEEFLARAGTSPENNVIGGFDVRHDSWRLIGGFRHVDRNPLFGHLANITGPGNGMVIGLGPNETDGVYSLTGPGAGVEPTVNTMIDDFVVRQRTLQPVL